MPKYKGRTTIRSRVTEVYAEARNVAEAKRVLNAQYGKVTNVRRA